MAFFNNISHIQYEGPQSTNGLSFKYYNPEEMIGDKKMEEILRFGVAYWHTFTFGGSDPFGAGNMIRSWDRYTDLDLAKARVEASFEFYEKLNVPFFCFHDVDIAPEADTLSETNRNLDIIVDLIESNLKTSKTKLLWNTVNLFSHPRFVHGAATAVNADVYAFAAAKVKKGLEVAKRLNANNYVFWGGREGYETLLNTDMKLEQDNLAHFLHMAVEYAQEIGFKGQLLIEPKPKEPTKHQYDFDVATGIGFLRTYGLDKHFKFNIEANHATLAGHTFEHELHVARINGMLGSVDANQGDTLLGWDTDEFPTDIYTNTLAMYEILKNGGLGKGGLNFDAKVRRGSFEIDDLFYAHIAGMDSFAIGLKVASNLLKDRVLEDFIEERYASFQYGIGKRIKEGTTSLKDLEEYALNLQVIENASGRTEKLRAIINQYILNCLSS